MQDMETKSLWSQINGECLEGDLKGKRLDQVAVRHTTYAEFKSDFPEAVMLTKPELGPAQSPYQNYFDDPSRMGIFGRVMDLQKLEGKDKVFGLSIGNQAYAVAESYLKEHHFATIGEKMVVVMDEKSGSVSAFNLPEEAKGEKLSVTADGLTVPIANVVWSTATGAVINGDSPALEPVSVVTAYWFAWFSFFPETVLVH